MTTNREQDFISEARTHAQVVYNGINALLALQVEWNALNYGANLDDGTGDNAEITAAQVGAVVFDTANELKLRILDTGHAANLAALL